VLGIAQTGTGKTAAFTLPMLTLLETGRARARMPRTLILEPTRELAAQVEDNFDKYGVNHKLSKALLIGGVSFGDQDEDHPRRGRADRHPRPPARPLRARQAPAHRRRALVIDEADRMLDMGFIPDIERIVKLVPFTRQTLFFSATMPPEIQRWPTPSCTIPSRSRSPAPASTARPSPSASSRRAGSRTRSAHPARADPRREDLQNASSSATASATWRSLPPLAAEARLQRRALHGDMDQHARMAALDGFRNGELPLLVASDVAARGLDIPAVSHVFNYDVPHHARTTSTASAAPAAPASTARS
jgi:superfamily II DNA/RNA helicase